MHNTRFNFIYHYDMLGHGARSSNSRLKNPYVIMLKFAYLLGGAWSQQGDGKVQTHTVLWWRTLFQWIVDLIRGDRCVYCLFPFLVWDCMASRSSLLWGKQNSCKVSKVLFPIWSVAEELDEHEGAHIVVKHMMFYAMYDSICKLWCAVKVHCW